MLDAILFSSVGGPGSGRLLGAGQLAVGSWQSVSQSTCGHHGAGLRSLVSLVWSAP